MIQLYHRRQRAQTVAKPLGATYILGDRLHNLLCARYVFGGRGCSQWRNQWEPAMSSVVEGATYGTTRRFIVIPSAAERATYGATQTGHTVAGLVGV